MNHNLFSLRIKTKNQASIEALGIGRMAKHIFDPLD